MLAAFDNSACPHRGKLLRRNLGEISSEMNRDWRGLRTEGKLFAFYFPLSLILDPRHDNIGARGSMGSLLYRPNYLPMPPRRPWSRA